MNMNNKNNKSSSKEKDIESSAPMSMQKACILCNKPMLTKQKSEVNKSIKFASDVISTIKNQYQTKQKSLFYSENTIPSNSKCPVSPNIPPPPEAQTYGNTCDKCQAKSRKKRVIKKLEWVIIIFAALLLIAFDVFALIWLIKKIQFNIQLLSTMHNQSQESIILQIALEILLILVLLSIGYCLLPYELLRYIKAKRLSESLIHIQYEPYDPTPRQSVLPLIAPKRIDFARKNKLSVIVKRCSSVERITNLSSSPQKILSAQQYMHMYNYKG